MATFWSIKYLATKGVERLDDCEVDRAGKYITYGVGFTRRFERIGVAAFATEAEAVEAAVGHAKSLHKSAVKRVSRLAALVKELEARK